MRAALVLAAFAVSSTACGARSSAQGKALAAPTASRCTPTADPSYLMMNAVLAVPTDSVRESAEIVLREHAFEIDRARTTSTVLTTQPTFRWPTGMDSTGFSRNPGVLMHVTTVARGDSTFLRVAARPVCMVRGKGDSVETSAGGRVVAMTSMLMVVAGISRRHGPR